MTAAAIDDVRDRPLPWFTGRLHEVLDDLGAPPTWPMSDAQLALTARELKRAIARLEGHLLAVVAEADRCRRRCWRGRCCWTRPRRSAPPVDAVPVEHRDAAEAHLLGCAGEHDARVLRVLGRRVLEVVAPEVADEHLARQLEAEEKQARGQALCAMLERFPVHRVPTHGGVSPRVVVSLETLLGGLRSACILGTGAQVSPGEARRLAAAAGVIPAVLDGASQLLDLVAGAGSQSRNAS